MTLEERIRTLNHSKEKRTSFSNYISNNKDQIPILLDIYAKVDDDISYRAAWGLEFFCKTHLPAIIPFLDTFLAIAPSVYQHPAVRPTAKIIEYLTLAYYKKKNKRTILLITKKQREQFIELCFDWLITDQKVAAKAYAMTSLHLLGTEFDWIHPELHMILKNTYAEGSAAYQARCRMILKKIKI